MRVIARRTARAMTTVLAGGDDLDPKLAEVAEPLRDRVANVVPVLADASRECEHVEPAERCAPSRRPPGRPGRCRGEAERIVEAAERLQARLLVEDAVEPSTLMPRRRRWISAPGSIDPERVAIGMPSSGVNPMVVSTERPSSTAVTEAPPPDGKRRAGGRARAPRRTRQRARGTRGARRRMRAASPRDRVAPDVLRQRPVEVRVGDRDVRDVGKRRCARLSASSAGRL